ncbi:MAG: ABC transporter ATP-binding protein [Candidatus Eremiobacterota bacterium]
MKIETIEVKNITKKFPAVIANDNVTITFRGGEVHTLLGENGAGKSTLMGVLYGKYTADEGEILINGKKTRIKSPKDAIEAGIGMVHQHFMLVPSLTVTENIILNYPSKREPFLNLKESEKKIKEISGDYGLDINPTSPVWQLSVGEQQKVEILKLLYRDATFLILDEPTAVLSPGEVEAFFITLRKLLSKGYGVIFISHKLQEVMEISDRITVLRNGKVTGTTTPKESSRNSLASMMVGRDLLETEKKDKNTEEKIVLSVENLSVENDMGLMSVKNISLQVKKGEILGIAGVSGNGQREFSEALAGLRNIKKGKITLKNIDITGKSSSFIIKAGLSFIPEERMTSGIIKDFSVWENAILKNHDSLSKWHFLKFKNIRKFAGNLVEQFNIKTPSADTPIKNLSGGNIQKLILARELSANPSLLIASHPTRGVDIGATEYIHNIILEKRREGMAVILISEDIDEIRALSDRIAVMYEGEIMGIVPPSEEIEKIGLMMGGERRS